MASLRFKFPKVKTLANETDVFMRAHSHGLRRALYLIKQTAIHQDWGAVTPDGRCIGCGSGECKDPHIEKHVTPGEAREKPPIKTNQFCKACGEPCILTIKPIEPFSWEQAHDPMTGEKRYKLISVSYTHLDVYKRQSMFTVIKDPAILTFAPKPKN